MTRVYKRILSVLLILSVVAGLCGCAFFDSIQANFESNSEYISAPELVRLLAVAINDQNQMADSYQAIPEEQREGVSYSQYYEYLNILRQFSTGNKKIVNFRFLNDEENSKHLDSIYNKLSQNSIVEDYYTVIKQYGDIKTVVFEYSRETESPVYTYISVNEDGSAHLSPEILSHTISAYNYMQQYFNLINQENVDGISSLIRLTEDYSDDMADRIRKAKAEYINDYYKYRVRNTTSQFVLLTANPFYVEYKIPEILSLDGDEISSRQIYAFRNPSGTIDIGDVISQDTTEDIITVNVSTTQSVKCGLEYDYSSLVRICGKPLSTYVKDGVLNTTEDEDGNVIEERFIIVKYNGMNLSFKALYTSDTEWIGELVNIRLFQNSKSAYPVCGIKVGDYEIKILEKFPMIDGSNGYILPYVSGTTKYTLNFEIKNSKVDNIVITKVEE